MPYKLRLSQPRPPAAIGLSLSSADPALPSAPLVPEDSCTQEDTKGTSLSHLDAGAGSSLAFNNLDDDSGLSHLAAGAGSSLAFNSLDDSSSLKEEASTLDVPVPR